MSNYSMITSGGLVAVTEASPHGILIDVRYFLPVYDWRIDPQIQPTLSGYSADDISTVANPEDTVPYGEIIWNATSGYNLSDSSTSICLISGANTIFQDGVDSDYVINPVQLQHQSINLYNNIPLTTCISATNLIYTPSAAGVSWILNNAVDFVGVNNRPVGDNSDFWSVVDYASVIADDGTSRGSFKCRINKDVGKFKFNKIALYAVRVNTNYEQYGDPFLFAQVILPNPEIKTGLNEGGLEEIVIDAQIQLTTEDIDWNDLYYGNNTDYWQKITEDGSLHHSEGVYIGKYAPEDTNNRLAKTVITTWENRGYGEDTDTVEFDKPQLALQNVTNATNVGHIATFKVDSIGNLNICLSADNGYYPDQSNEDYLDINTMGNVMVLPEHSEKFFIGSKDNRFKCYYGGTSGTSDFCGDYYGDVGQHNEPINDLLAVDIHGGGIQIGRSSDLNRNDFTYGLKMIDRSIKLEDRFFNNSHILGADLRMNDDQSMFIYTTKPTVSYDSTKPTSGSNVYLIAGALDNSFNTLFSDKITKENLENVFTSANNLDLNNYFDSNANMYFVAKGGLNFYSTMKLFSNTIGNDYNHSILYSHNYLQNNKNEKLLLIAGVIDGVFDSEITNASEGNDYSFIINETSVLELVGGKSIRFWGDIYPIINGEDDTNPLTIQSKFTSIDRKGFKIEKLLDIVSCNATIDNMRFYSYYEQPFARFQNLNLNYAFDTSRIFPQTGPIGPAVAPNNGYIGDVLKYAKWARIGNIVFLKFILNLKFDLGASRNAKFSFKLPQVESNSKFDKNTELFQGDNNYLYVEVEGTNLTKFEDQDSTNPDSTSQYYTQNSIQMYHPVELMFSKDYSNTSDPTEVEKKVLIPVYTSLNSLGQPSNGNPTGSYPYDNPFGTCSVRFYISKSEYSVDFTDLLSYFSSYPTGGNAPAFDGIKTDIDYLINAQAKDGGFRSAEETYALSLFTNKFYSWESFNKMLLNRGVDTRINIDNFIFHQGKKDGRYKDWSIKFSSGVFKYDPNDIYTNIWNIVDNGYIYLKEFSDEFSTILTQEVGSIIKINYNQFGGPNQEAYFKIGTSPELENYNSLDTNNKIGDLTADGVTINSYVPMIKTYDLRLGEKRRWTFGCYGKVTNTIHSNSRDFALTNINNNTW